MSSTQASARGTGANAVLAGITLACIGAVVAALVSQHVYDMQPCPWCVLQRVIFLAIALACALGLLWRGTVGRIVSIGLAMLLTLAGAAAALWQHFQAAASASCKLTLADKIVSGWLHLDSLWPAVFSPRASCADAAVSLLGVPYDFWSLALFLAIGTALTLALIGVLRKR
jgi:protein dithiol:quinone oxidoreductase